MVARTEGNRQGGILCDLLSEFDGLAAQIFFVRKHIGQTHFIGFLAGNAASGQKQHMRFLLTNQTRQRVGETEARMEAEFHEIRGKARFRANHSEVRHDGQSKASANGCALHGSHNRDVGIKQSYGGSVQWIACLDFAVGTFFVARGAAEIVTGAKVLALAAQHDGTNLFAGFHFAKRVGQILDHLRIEKVVGSALYFNHGNVVFDGDADSVVVHIRHA
jgi:hypothetical protein